MKKIIYTTKVKTYAYDVDSNNAKIAGTENLERTVTREEMHIFADEGKVFKRISTGEVLTAHIGIGSNDDVNDFEEIDAE